MFHSVYYAKCKKARQLFAEASTKLADYNLGFGAVDCHRKPEQGCKLTCNILC